MLPYQNQTVERFIQLLPRGTRDILEIGSDIEGEVVSALAERTGARVVGINPSQEFPKLVGHRMQNTCFLRMDGRAMPFPDNSFDAVLSVATMEHVNGLEAFLSDITRVLRPKGVFFTELSPIWSSALGHHVFAVVGSKEARFWKPGKNPIPAYAHLLMTPDEMRSYLRSGPCSEELIEPIIHWIYYGNNLNRCHFEDYMEAFRKCPLVVAGMSFSCEGVDSETLTDLHLKYGAERDFNCSSISGVFRKSPEGKVHRLIFRNYITVRKLQREWIARQTARLKLVKCIVLFPFSPFLKLWCALTTQKKSKYTI